MIVLNQFHSKHHLKYFFLRLHKNLAFDVIISPMQILQGSLMVHYFWANASLITVNLIQLFRYDDGLDIRFILCVLCSWKDALELIKTFLTFQMTLLHEHWKFSVVSKFFVWFPILTYLIRVSRFHSKSKQNKKCVMFRFASYSLLARGT